MFSQETAERAWERCKETYKVVDKIKDDVCEGILDQIVDYSRKDPGKYCINTYDIRLSDEGPNDGCGLYKWPVSVPDVKIYLQRDDVVKALHVEKKRSKWEECNTPVLWALSGDGSIPSYKLLPELLQRIQVLLFSGAQDLICNWYGTQAMIDELAWNGAVGMQNTTKFDWYLEDRMIGTYQSARNLSFAIFKNGSHMVPVDEPAAALEMWNRFIEVDGGKSVYADPNTKVAPSGTPANANKETHYYMAGTVLLVLLLMTGITCCVLQCRKHFVQTDEKGARPRVLEEGGRPTSGWQEVSGDDEDLFYAPEDGEEQHALGAVAR
ncbi:Cell death protease [Rhizophlyctis rosea]|uniref:Pheromone-processing carboxypeptidase KEX1 n=1 Tax=Rhizophlyctis rosea TaxID=64517 RepID=A0AAD5SC41_9FUNG|nr:Cell death protease [Rhizophlyctis rosea]